MSLLTDEDPPGVVVLAVLAVLLICTLLRGCGGT